LRFHDASGPDYVFLADEIMTFDPINRRLLPALSSRSVLGAATTRRARR
jgi:hypothetical protein